MCATEGGKGRNRSARGDALLLLRAVGVSGQRPLLDGQLACVPHMYWSGGSRVRCRV